MEEQTNNKSPEENTKKPPFDEDAAILEWARFLYSVYREEKLKKAINNEEIIV